MSSSERSDEAPFAAEAGIRLPPRVEVDPYRILDDLMAAIEALCPTWPRREPFGPADRMLL